MKSIIDTDPWVILIIMIVLVVPLFIWNVMLTVKGSRLKKRLTQIVGNTGVPHLEEVLGKLHQEVHSIQTDHHKLEQNVLNLQKMSESLKGYVGIRRYNAFSDTGSDLSFSIAFVDQSSSGIVLSGIHNRENMYFYAKPIEAGESTYTLTPEERSAIDQAIQRQRL